MAATTHTNEYEEQARVIKALNLVATLRAMKYTHGDVADCFDAGDWDTLARIADVNPPSKRTQTMVLRMMELAEAAADDPFVGVVMTTISAEMPVVGVVVSLNNLNGPIHLARHNRNGVSSACNGRQVNLPVLDEVPANEITCKRCRKLVTL